MNGIRLQRIDRGPSSYAGPPLGVEQAAATLADLYRRGERGIEAVGMDGRPLPAMTKVALLRIATDLLKNGTPR